MNNRRLLKLISVLAAFLILLVSATALCGCEKIKLYVAYAIVRPRPYTIKNPDKFLEEKRGMELPSGARVDYYCASTYFRGESYFFACYYPDVPEELNKYVGASLTDEDKSSIIQSLDRSLTNLLNECGKSLDDLDDKMKPDWDSPFITNKERNIPCFKFLVYFPETQYYLLWWSTS